MNQTSATMVSQAAPRQLRWQPQQHQQQQQPQQPQQQQQQLDRATNCDRDITFCADGKFNSARKSVVLVDENNNNNNSNNHNDNNSNDSDDLNDGKVDQSKESVTGDHSSGGDKIVKMRCRDSIADRHNNHNHLGDHVLELSLTREGSTGARSLDGASPSRATPHTGYRSDTPSEHDLPVETESNNLPIVQHFPTPIGSFGPCAGVISRPLNTNKLILAHNDTIADCENRQRRISSVMCDELAQFSAQPEMESCTEDEFSRYFKPLMFVPEPCKADSPASVLHPSIASAPSRLSPSLDNSVRFCMASVTYNSRANHCELVQTRDDYYDPNPPNGHCTITTSAGRSASGPGQTAMSNNELAHDWPGQQVASSAGDTAAAESYSAAESYYALADLHQQPSPPTPSSRPPQYSEYYKGKPAGHYDLGAVEVRQERHTDSVDQQVGRANGETYTADENRPRADERKLEFSGQKQARQEYETGSGKQQVGLVYVRGDDLSQQEPMDVVGYENCEQMIGYKAVAQTQEYCYQQQQQLHADYANQHHQSQQDNFTEGAQSSEVQCYATQVSASGSPLRTFAGRSFEQHSPGRVIKNPHTSPTGSLVAESDGKTFHVLESTSNTHISDPMQLLAQYNSGWHMQQEPYIVVPAERAGVGENDAEQYATDWGGVSCGRPQQHQHQHQLHLDQHNGVRYPAADATAQDAASATQQTLPHVEGYYDPNVELNEYLNSRMMCCDDDANNNDDGNDNECGPEHDDDDDVASSVSAGSSISARTGSERSSRPRPTGGQLVRRLNGAGASGNGTNGPNGPPGCKPYTLQRLKEFLERKFHQKQPPPSPGPTYAKVCQPLSTSMPPSELHRRQLVAVRRYSPMAIGPMDDHSSRVLAMRTKDRTTSVITDSNPRGELDRSRAEQSPADGLGPQQIAPKACNSQRQQPPNSLSSNSILASNNISQHKHSAPETTPLRPCGSASSSPVSSSTISTPPPTPSSALYGLQTTTTATITTPSSAASSMSLLSAHSNSSSSDSNRATKTSPPHLGKRNTGGSTESEQAKQQSETPTDLSDYKQLRSRTVVPQTTTNQTTCNGLGSNRYTSGVSSTNAINNNNSKRTLTTRQQVSRCQYGLSDNEEQSVEDEGLDTCDGLSARRRKRTGATTTVAEGDDANEESGIQTRGFKRRRGQLCN